MGWHVEFLRMCSWLNAKRPFVILQSFIIAIHTREEIKGETE
jgi:hypothetical protein